MALAPVVLAGSLDTHLGHRAGQAEARIFTDAHHAGQAEHFDTAESSHLVRCSDCLAPAQPLVPRPPRSARLGSLAPDQLPVREVAEPSNPAGKRSWCPRGPPSSVLF